MRGMRPVVSFCFPLRFAASVGVVPHGRKQRRVRIEVQTQIRSSWHSLVPSRSQPSGFCAVSSPCADLLAACSAAPGKDAEIAAAIVAVRPVGGSAAKDTVVRPGPGPLRLANWQTGSPCCCIVLCDPLPPMQPRRPLGFLGPLHPSAAAS